MREMVTFGMIDNIGIITISNPPVNALEMKVVRSLKSLVCEVERLGKARTVIVTADGTRFFSAGADIHSLLDIDENEAKAMVLEVQDVLNKIEACPIPVICAVNGKALGGGCELALACDLIVACEQAEFGLPEVNVGLIPGAGGMQRMSRRIGILKAKELVYTGTSVSAAEAYRIGLINRLTADESPMGEAMNLANEICEKSPISIRLAKHAINVGRDQVLEVALKLDAEMFGRACSTSDKKEGITAFLEKRKPIFTGR